MVATAGMEVLLVVGAALCGAVLGLCATRLAARLLEGRLDPSWMPSTWTRRICAAVGASICALLIVHLGPTADCLELMAFSCVLIAVLLTDLVAWVIPNAAVLLAVAIRACYLVFVLLTAGPPAAVAALATSLVGAGAVAAFLGVTALVMNMLCGSSSLGGGDLKLLMVAGLYFGWRRMVVVVMASCLFGVLGAPHFRSLARRQGEEGVFPFGPAIAAACWLCALCGNDLVAWYLALLP